MPIKPNFPPPHAGGFIKDAIIPDGMAVTRDAEHRVFGVGCPAVSQLLNEKASLSPEMAMRLEHNQKIGSHFSDCALNTTA